MRVALTGALEGRHILISPGPSLRFTLALLTGDTSRLRELISGRIQRSDLPEGSTPEGLRRLTVAEFQALLQSIEAAEHRYQEDELRDLDRALDGQGSMPPAWMIGRLCAEFGCTPAELFAMPDDLPLTMLAMRHYAHARQLVNDPNRENLPDSPFVRLAWRFREEAAQKARERRQHQQEG